MALVQLYEKAEQDRSTPPVAEGPSGEDGSFSITAPAGLYYVWAKATMLSEGREYRLVGEAVPNPVAPAAGGSATVEIELTDPSGFSASTAPEGSGVMGNVTATGKGKERLTLYIYRGAHERPIGPDFITATDPEEGAFKVNLLPGEYTLAIRSRKSGNDFGPPAPEDRVFSRIFTVKSGEYMDLGPISLNEIDSDLWRSVTASLGDGSTKVKGVIVNDREQPEAGVRVLAFEDGRMAGKPVAVSPATGIDGSFTLLLPRGGSFFLGARSRIGGPAAPGERVGQERGEDGGGLKVKEGETVKGVKIVVEEVW
ncbi:MAG: hypothetical protein C0608_00230 [Deltaproteobacteria bacterium]|nr:MAG: hypothetical protein C0608_00230 [Deltaproteobacteria bacterium]